MACVFSFSSRLLDSTCSFEQDSGLTVFSSKTSPCLWLVMKAAGREHFAKNIDTTGYQHGLSVLHLCHFHWHHCCFLSVLCLSGLLDMLQKMNLEYIILHIVYSIVYRANNKGCVHCVLPTHRQTNHWTNRST